MTSTIVHDEYLLYMTNIYGYDKYLLDMTSNFGYDSFIILLLDLLAINRQLF